MSMQTRIGSYVYMRAIRQGWIERVRYKRLGYWIADLVTRKPQY